MSWQEEMVEELIQAQNGEKSLVMKRYETMTGKTATHLYRIAKKYGYESGRKRRSDKGECVLTENQIMFLAGLIVVTGRKNKNEIMSVKSALDIAETNGIIDPGSVSVSRVQELLRERGLNKKSLRNKRTHTAMRSLHPNHVHFMDVSVCIQYYLKDRKLRIERQDKFYKNKFENFAKIKRKIYRYVLTDHFSHTIFLKYYIAQGETSVNLFDFLVSAWEAKGNANKFPFRGVPFYLMMDKGAANTSYNIKKFLRKMDVEFLEGLPHNPRRQGSVERAQLFVERNFEARLRLQPVSGIEELNAYALDWCAFMNSHPMHTHSRFGTPRLECWLKIKQEQLRECPDREVLQALFAGDGNMRKVYGDYSFQFEGRRYRVKHIQGLDPNVSKVKVFRKPLSAPQVMVEFNGQEYLVSPIEIVDGGFDADAPVIGQEFKSMPESRAEKAAKVIDNLAYGEERVKGDVPFHGLHVFGGQGDRIKAEYMPRKSTPMEISKQDIAQRRITMFDLFREMGRVGTMTPALNRAIRDRYGESVSLEERDALLEAMENGCLVIDSNGGLSIGGANDSFAAVAN